MTSWKRLGTSTIVAVLTAMAAGSVCVAQTSADSAATTATLGVSDAVSERTPRGALWRAAVVPGWGQAYNRQYGKLPFVYAGLGGLIATAVILNDRYELYTHAYQYKAFAEITPDGEENPREHFESDYLKLLERRGVSALSSGSIRPTRDALRRNRDLSILGAGVVFGLSILDAYVSAQLMDFDISEDLTVSVHPAAGGMRTSLRVSL